MGALFGLGSIAVLVSSVLSGLITFGTYGALRDKGWGPWKAGALTGLVGGLVGAVSMIAMGATAASLSGVFVEPVRGLGELTITALPRHVGMLTAQRLAGYYPPTEGLSVNDLQGFGAYDIDVMRMMPRG